MEKTRFRLPSKVIYNLPILNGYGTMVIWLNTRSSERNHRFGTLDRFSFSKESNEIVTTTNCWLREKPSSGKRYTWTACQELALLISKEEVSVAVYTSGQQAKQVQYGKYIAGLSILAGTSVTMFLLAVLNVFPSASCYVIPLARMLVEDALIVTGVTVKMLRDEIKIQKKGMKKLASSVKQ